MTEQRTDRLTLEVFEREFEREIQRWENSAIKIGEWLNRARDASVHTEAGYRYFAPYYRDRWQERIGRSWWTAKNYMEAARVTEEMAGSVDQRYPVTDYLAARKLHTIEDNDERNRVWNEHVESGERRAGYGNLDRRIREHKTGVIEQAEARGVVVPDEPKGKTPSEAAWLAMTTASRVIKGVEPADAARVESGKVAGRYVEQMAELAEWMHLFVHELNLYAEQQASGASNEARR